jgi:predicted MFS family arabinose efflux permease
MYYRYIQLFVVIASSILGLIATDIILPSLPHIGRFFAVPANDAKMLISMYLLGQFSTVLPWGMISDHIGRRNALFSGMLLFLLGSVLSLYAYSINLLLVARFLQGAGAVVAPVAGWALIQDLFPKDEGARILAWVGTLTAVLPLIAPALGGTLEVLYGWRSTFFCIAGYAIVLCFLLLILPNKGNPPASKMKKIPNRLSIYWRIIRNKTFVSYISLFGLLNCGEWCFLTVVPFYYEHKNIPPDSVGFLLMFTSMGFVFGSLLSSKFFKLFGIDKTIHIGIHVAVASSSLLLLGEMFHWTNYSLFDAIVLSIYIASNALLWGGTTSRALQCYEEYRGVASAVRSLILLCFSSFGTYFGRFLPSITLYPLALFLLFLSLCAFMVFNNKELKEERLGTDTAY